MKMGLGMSKAKGHSSAAWTGGPGPLSPIVLQQCLSFNHIYSLLGEGVPHEWLMKERQCSDLFTEGGLILWVWAKKGLQHHSGLVLGDSLSRLATKTSRGPLWVGGKSRMESNNCCLQGCSLSYFLSLLSVQLASWEKRWALAMQGCFPTLPLRTAGPFPNCGSSACTWPSAASLGFALGQGFSDLHCWHLRPIILCCGVNSLYCSMFSIIPRLYPLESHPSVLTIHSVPRHC